MLKHILSKKNIALLLTASLTTSLALAGGAASAQMLVTTTINSMCDISVGSLEFGSYNPLNQEPLDSDTSVRVVCTNTTPYSVSLDKGMGADATIDDRKMANGTSVVNYSLYQDVARLNLWGNTPLTMVSGIGSGYPQNLTIYGRIFATNEHANPPGTYTDTVTVAVNF